MVNENMIFKMKLGIQYIEGLFGVYVYMYMYMPVQAKCANFST